MLITSQDVENYKLIKADLDRLRTLVEKSELWVEKKSSGGGDGKKDKKEKGEVGSKNIIIYTFIFTKGIRIYKIKEQILLEFKEQRGGGECSIIRIQHYVESFYKDLRPILFQNV